MESQPETTAAPGTASARALIVLVNLMIWLGWVALAIFTVSAVLFALGFIPESLELPAPVHLVLDGAGEQGDVPQLLAVEGEATVLVGRHDPIAANAFCILLLLYFGCLQYGAYQFRRVVLAIGSGQPFVAEVPRSLIRLGLVLLIGWPVNSLLAWLFAGRVVATVVHQGMRLNATLPEKDINWLMAGLFCLVLAAAFQAGRRLQDEQDLTI